MKKIGLSLVIFSLAFGLAAEYQFRPFDVHKNSYDPFVAEKGGFESLFVNPAAMAGETDIFTLDIEAEGRASRSTIETLQFMMDNSEALTPSENPDAESMTEEDAEELVELLADNLDEESIDLLTDGTSIEDLETAEDIQAYFEGGGTLTENDIDTLSTNVEENQDEILEKALGNLEVSVELTTKLGTLIKGFGIGVYANGYSLLNAGVMGFEKAVLEIGVKAGYGFNLGPFGVGVSGDFAMIGDPTYYGSFSALDFNAMSNQMMVYGYAWGIDAGMTFDILPSLTVGAVMTDIIGTYSPAGEATVSNFFSGGASTAIDFNYDFNLDLDFGVTWAPKLGSGKLFNASFSADYYDFFGVFYADTRPQEFQDWLNHIRLGAHFELLSFINLRAQYYREYFTLGAGVDLFILEIFGEFQFKQSFDDLGAAMLVKLHF